MINPIKEKRHNKGMFQKTLADKIGVSERTVRRWEKDETYPGVMEMNKLEEILGLDILELTKYYIDKSKEV